MKDLPDLIPLDSIVDESVATFDEAVISSLEQCSLNSLTKVTTSDYTGFPRKFVSRSTEKQT